MSLQTEPTPASAIEKKFDEFESVTARLAIMAEVLSDLASKSSDCDANEARRTLSKLHVVNEQIGIGLQYAESIVDEIDAASATSGGEVEEIGLVRVSTREDFSIVH
jgi:hypothetical protein